MAFTDPFPPEDMYCHLTGFEKKCLELVSSRKCHRWRMVQGTDKNTGQPVSGWDCIDNWQNHFTIEANQLINQVGAATESFRNVVVRLALVAANENPGMTKAIIAELEKADPFLKQVGPPTYPKAIGAD